MAKRAYIIYMNVCRCEACCLDKHIYIIYVFIHSIAQHFKDYYELYQTIIFVLANAMPRYCTLGRCWKK